MSSPRLLATSRAPSEYRSVKDSIRAGGHRSHAVGQLLDFLLQPEGGHDDLLIDRTVGVVAAGVAEDKDAAIGGLQAARVVGSAGKLERCPGLAGVGGGVDAAGG